MHIKYYKKNVYGIEYMYIKDDKQLKIVKGLTGRKTLSHSDLHFLSALGCTHELVHENEYVNTLATA